MLQTKLPTVVIRHRKENLKKCSLRGLESRPDFQFFRYPMVKMPDLTGYVMLAMEGEELTEADGAYGLLLIDATWRYAAQMIGAVDKEIILPKRTLPRHFRTAYPRVQTECPNPEEGLASVEALYLAYMLTGRPTEGLLDGYYWKEQFLRENGFFGL
jgi:pre-rRNA-processing protein TSR3